MKQILLLHTGGTFGMVPTEPDEILAPGNFQEEILSHVPELLKIAHIDIKIPFNLDSSDVGIAQWDHLAQIINDNMENYDGFVIIHGTDTMVYTAAALSFSLINLPKPVVLTGSQRPLSRLRSDARFNLIDAVELATMDIREVIIVFGRSVLRGNRAKKTSISKYDAFLSPNFPRLGEIGLNIDLKENLLFSPSDGFNYKQGFSNKVALLHIYPSLAPKYFEHLMDGSLKAIILVAYGAGNLPAVDPDWISFIKRADRNNIVTFLASQSIHGNVNLQLYDSGQRAEKAGATGLGAMTIESAYIKLQKILVYTQNKHEIIEQLYQNWAGEI